MVSASRLSSSLVAGMLSLAACTSSASTPATTSPVASQTGSGATTPVSSTPAATTPTTAGTSGSAAADCSKAKDAVKAMASVIAQGSLITKVSLSTDCKVLSVWTTLKGSQLALAQTICRQIDAPAYAGGAQSVTVATADGNVVLAKGVKGQACNSGL